MEYGIKPNRKAAKAVTLFLMLAMFASLLALPTLNAHTPAWSNNTYCYIAPCPPTVGVNQQVLLVIWINPFPPTAIGAMGDRWTFFVDITKPDGTAQTLGPLTSDPTGSTYSYYVPTVIGTYTLVARFPGQTITGVPEKQTASTSTTPTRPAPASPKPSRCNNSKYPITKRHPFQQATGHAQYTTQTEAGAPTSWVNG